MLKGAVCYPRALKILIFLKLMSTLSNSKHEDKISQLVPVIEKVIVIVMITTFRKTLHLVIVFVIVTIFATKVICNCNDYILNTITSPWYLHCMSYSRTSARMDVNID